MKSFYAYGDDSNDTVCIRGDIHETYWMSSRGSDEPDLDRDVIVVSDGSVVEFYRNPGETRTRIRMLATGSAFKAIDVCVESDECSFEGEVSWVLVACKQEFLEFQTRLLKRQPKPARWP